MNGGGQALTTIAITEETYNNVDEVDIKLAAANHADEESAT